MSARAVAPQPLLCELHCHSTWSDGDLTPDELVELYGAARFDVLCITDHVVGPDDPDGPLIDARNHGAYLDAVGAAAQDARSRFGMLVIPGIELTDSNADADLAAHAVAIGLDRLVTLDHGLPEALREARSAGAALVAAHPHSTGDDPIPFRTTRRFWLERDRFRPLLDRWELINRTDVFSWVAGAGLPGIASGDFHRPEHLATWKTVLPCEKDPAAVVAHLRSDRPAFVTRYAPAADVAA